MSFSHLETGDPILVAAPAGPFKKDLFLQGIKNLEKIGFQPKYRKDIASQKKFLAGTDQRRSQEIIDTLTDRSSRVLLFARGGYGCQRIVENLPPKISPKLLIGSSDLTVLLNVVWQKYHIPSLYGPMVAPHFRDEKNAKILKKVLTDPHYFSKQKLKAKKIIRPGKAKGTIVGGCLSLVISTLKTPWEIDTDDKILLLEDTHEAPYKVDRMLTQLLQSGKLSRVKALVLGTFRLKETSFPKEIRDVVEERLKNFSKPVLWGIPFGHCPHPLYVPIGLTGEVSEGQLKILDNILI
ncbi:MAG: LD-carboxypeptidase [Deltaproteobacteria bacterium]|nr:MAG: LD-carboxypeptidase [Deltaproteobacteria bacterium]